MAHPFAAHRAHKVEHARVGHITKGYASGGAVHSDAKQDRKLFKKLMKEEDAQEVEGGEAKERMDRPGRAGRKTGGKVVKRGDGGKTPNETGPEYGPRSGIEGALDRVGVHLPPSNRMIASGKTSVWGPDVSSSEWKGEANKKRGGAVNRARGGRTRHKGHTTVNVITGGGHPAAPLAAGPPPGGIPGMGASPMLPPRPPMPPPGLPPGGPGMAPPGLGGPPGMMPPGMPPRSSGGRAYAKGGAVKSGPAWEEGKRAGTPVQNNPSGKNDQRDVGRGKPITYKTGGAVEAPMGPKPLTPHLPGGSGGGEARLAKEKMAKRGHGMAP